MIGLAATLQPVAKQKYDSLAGPGWAYIEVPCIANLKHLHTNPSKKHRHGHLLPVVWPSFITMCSKGMTLNFTTNRRENTKKIWPVCDRTLQVDYTRTELQCKIKHRVPHAVSFRLICLATDSLSYRPNRLVEENEWLYLNYIKHIHEVRDI